MFEIRGGHPIATIKVHSALSFHVSISYGV